MVIATLDSDWNVYDVTANKCKQSCQFHINDGTTIILHDALADSQSNWFEMYFGTAINQHKQVQPSIYHLVLLVGIPANLAFQRNAHDRLSTDMYIHFIALYLLSIPLKSRIR
jgi:hypothetical protein